MERTREAMLEALRDISGETPSPASPLTRDNESSPLLSRVTASPAEGRKEGSATDLERSETSEDDGVLVDHPTST